jgi:nitroreductase
MTNDFFDVARRQRAHRSFTSDPVSDALISQLLDHATFAPSAENTQPWEFIVVDRDGTRSKLAEMAKRAWDGGARDFERSRLSDRLFADVDHGMTEGFASAPVWVVVLGDSDRVMSAAMAESIYPAVQNILLGATALGLGSALTTIVNVFPDELRELLGFPDSLIPFAAIPLGHPARQLGLSRRDSASERTHHNRYSPKPRKGEAEGD